jgi:hypothetical protein
MKMLRALWLRIWSWFESLLQAPYRTQKLEGDLPRKLHSKTIYVVEEDGYLEHVAMVCPCGCDQVLYMNLIPDERPCWRVIDHQDGTISLRPSVWRQKGCHSHFWFRQGRVFWVNQ